MTAIDRGASPLFGHPALQSARDHLASETLPAPSLLNALCRVRFDVFQCRDGRDWLSALLGIASTWHALADTHSLFPEPDAKGFILIRKGLSHIGHAFVTESESGQRLT